MTCAALQPLMYGAPFYSMPFTYPPASSTAQMPTEQSPGVATGLIEPKPSDADGEPKHDDDDSDPVTSPSSLPFHSRMGRPAASLPVDPAGDVHLGCCLSNPQWHLTWPDVQELACLQASNDDGTAGQEGLKPEAGGAQQPQSQPEGLQYLLPPDANNHAAALAALLRAQQSTGGDAELWRQQAAQLAGSGVDLSHLAATAAGQGHILPGVCAAPCQPSYNYQ